MIDFSDSLAPSGNDIVFLDTSQYKIRNILKSALSENPYNPSGGTQLSQFYDNLSQRSHTLALSIGQRLFSAQCQISELTLRQKNGIFDVSIISQVTPALPQEDKP